MMNKKILLASGLLAGATLLVGLVIVKFGAMPKGASAAMPDNQCYKMASQKDQALENSLELNRKCEEPGDPYYPACLARVNLCTGQSGDTWVYYRSDNKGVTNIRTEYGNGDAEGYLGMTHYWVCHSNGTAKVTQRIYGPIWAWTPWGFWWNFPFDDDPSTWVKDKEVCNTLIF